MSMLLYCVLVMCARMCVLNTVCKKAKYKFYKYTLDFSINKGNKYKYSNFFEND